MKTNSHGFNFNTIIKSGLVLIAKPYVNKPEMENAVIIITGVMDDEITGLIVNRPTGILTAMDLEMKTQKGFPLYYGGPNESEVVSYLYHPTHRGWDYTSTLIWGYNVNTLENILATSGPESEEVSFYTGAVKWRSEELESELLNNQWWKGAISLHELFTNPPSRQWATLVHKFGGYFSALSDFDDRFSIN